ncbi:MAG: glycosyltransferase [Clostridiales bacterium]|nr:glycosyltransferase [Clostridiales bacterium]
MNYKVSVILPIMNVEQYLHECLDSVTRQTLKELEIICVDDGSTDSSLAIIQEYAAKDDRVVVISGPNGGYGKAMNKGLDRATGEYIGIVEPDDYVPLDMFEDLYRIASEKKLDIVKADFYRFGRSSDGDMQMKYVALDGSRTRYGELLHPDQDPSLIKFVMNTWAGIYRRAFIEEYHIRHHETPGASFQDNGFFFQTTIHAKTMMIVDRPYYRNRRDNPNSSVNNKEKVYCANIEYDWIRDILMEDREVWERFRNLFYWKKFQNGLFTIDRIGQAFKYEYIQRMGREFKRALQKKEFSQEPFTALEWRKLTMIMEKPDEYYTVFVANSDRERKLSAELTKTKAELELIKHSTTYKVGRIIMYIPCALKRMITGESR